MSWHESFFVDNQRFAQFLNFTRDSIASFQAYD